MPSFPYYKQRDQMDCGPTCLRMVAKHYGKHYSSQTLREKSQISREGVSMLGIAEAAEAIGFRSVGVKVTLEKLLEQAPLPCILHWGQNHFVVLYGIKRSKTILSRQRLKETWGGKRPTVELDSYIDKSVDQDQVGENVIERSADSSVMFRVADPGRGLITYTLDEFEKLWLSNQKKGSSEGLALLLEPTARFDTEEGEEETGLQFKQLFGFIWRYKRLVLQLALGMVVGSMLSLLFPFLTQSVVDVGINTQNLSFIYIILIAQFALLFGSATVDFLRSWILLHISTRLNLTILSEFLSKLMRLPVSFFDVKKFGDIMQRIGDHQRIEAFLTNQTLGVLFSFVNLFVFGLVLAYYHLSIFLVAIGFSVLYGVWVILFLKQRRVLDTKRFAVSSRNQSQIVQLIHGMQDIKLSGAETQKRWEWERTQASLFKWNVKSLAFSQYQQAGALLINQSKNIAITFLAAKGVLDGQITLGAMMSIQYILGQFNAPIEQMITFLQHMQDAQISLERLNEVHSLPDEEPASEAKRKEWDANLDIRISNLSYTYPGAGNDPVLRNVNLTIPHGKTTAIVGTSGSGKTTLLKLLLRFYEIQSGSISLGTTVKQKDFVIDNSTLADQSSPIGTELDLKHISHRAWRQQCGVVMQEGFLFSDSIARNIAVNDEVIDQDRLYHAANVANIHQFIESLPLGYHTRIGAEGSGISQGQKQRILIARSVYKNPQLLLFDEATNSLDANNEAIIIKNLEEFFKGRTVVVVAHRLSTVKHANQIVVLEKGEIVEIGTHAQLIDKKGKYFELVSNQLELGT
ncbi:MULTISPECIES: peptidase domain-containing ABC transporter [Dyadobacter]|nr:MULTISPECIES: peptidase domain-containing ABC transporter [Dyadobacter]